MYFTTFTASILNLAILAIAAPAVPAGSPPNLVALYRELRDYHCETGGIDTKAILSNQAGQCISFKNKDTAGVLLTFIGDGCNLLVFNDQECKEQTVAMTKAQCWGDDVRTFGSAIVECGL